MDMIIECLSANGFNQYIDNAPIIPRVGESIVLYKTLESSVQITRTVAHIEYDFTSSKIYVSVR
jgi:hypothetical protein